MPLLSVIIPAYNASSTIRLCLESVFSLPLTESEREVIVVDDCSTDDTLSVLSQFKSVVVVHQAYNQRQGAARNKGIDICSGEYVIFVDADDIISSDGILQALEAVRKSGSDICYFGFEFQTKDKSWRKVEVPEAVRNSIVDSKTYLEEYYTTYFNGPWRSLYRTSFLKGTGIRFVEGVQWEDCDWSVKVLSRAKTIQFVDGVGYRYCFNGNSTIRHRNAGTMANRIYAGRRLMEFGEEVRETLPRLSEKVTAEGKNQYVVEALRLRNLTKYPIGVVKELYRRMGEEGRNALLPYEWPFWVHFFLRNKVGSLAFLHLACPCARLGRSLMRHIRKTGLEK